MNDKPKILLVDDKSENLTALETLLKPLDIESIRAVSGNEALQKTQEHEFVLALIDVQMPEMDGYETVKLMRRVKKTQHLPVILISAIQAEDYSVIKGIENGAVDFITRPIIPEILIGKVRVFLDLYLQRQALQNSEANLSEAQRIAHLGSWDCNLVTDEIIWSNELYRIFDVPKETSDLRKALAERIHPDDWERYRKTVDRSIQKKLPYEVEYRIILPDGTERHIHAQGVQTRDKEGKLVRFAGTAQDITDLKKAEEALKKANEKLRKLDQAKSDFLSIVSHEIRTPIAMMREGISLCLDEVAGKINETQSDLLTTTLENIDRLTRLVTDLLDISKIEAGKIGLRRSPLDLCDVIKKISKDYKNRINEKAIQLKTDIPEKPVEFHADRDKITQVFNNLLSNAVRFTGTGGKITIRVEEKKEMIECSVSDTGLGIARENISKLFSKFEQIGRVDGPGYKGTGLGLTIVKGLVERHGGHIWVESELGKGSTFRFNLPKTPFPDILIVDDEETVIDVIKKFLRDENYLFTEAHNGEEAVQKALDEKPSLIILDMMLPGISGYEVIGRLKQDTRTHDIPIIIISGYDVNDEMIQRVDSKTAIPFLTKPLNSQILQTKVRDMLVS